MPSVPALALGVVAPPVAAAGHSGRSSSRRPSSRRSGDGKTGSNRVSSGRSEFTTKNITSGDTTKTTVIDSANKKSGIDEGADAGRARQPGVHGEAGIVNGGHGSAGGGSEGQAAAGRTVPVPVKRRISVQIVAAKIVDKVCWSSNLRRVSRTTSPVRTNPAREIESRYNQFSAKINNRSKELLPSKHG